MNRFKKLMQLVFLALAIGVTSTTNVWGGDEATKEALKVDSEVVQNLPHEAALHILNEALLKTNPLFQCRFKEHGFTRYVPSTHDTEGPFDYSAIKSVEVEAPDQYGFYAVTLHHTNDLTRTFCYIISTRDPAESGSNQKTVYHYKSKAEILNAMNRVITALNAVGIKANYD